MQKLVWQNANGETIDLTSGSYGITEWEGFSNASLNIQSQQVPFQDGAVFLDALIEPRELSVTLAMQDNNDLELRYQLRRELIHKLNPKLGEGYLIYTNDFISKRIKCVAQIPLFETHNSNDSGTPKASLSWVANEPYWEDLEETSVAISGLNTIQNDGDISAQVEIIIPPDASNPAVINRRNQKQIKLFGSYDNAVEINTNLGQKYAKSEVLDFTWVSGGTFYGVAFGNGKYVYVGTQIVVEDYLSGKIISVDIGEYLEMHDIIYINDMFFAGGRKIISSPDGINWNILTGLVGPNNQGFIQKITYHDNLYIAVGYEGSSRGIIYTSSDGITWNGQSINNAYFNSITYGNGLFVAVGVNSLTATEKIGIIYTSSDGITWTSRTSGATSEFRDIIYANNLFVAVGNNGIIYTSSDGITWTSRTSGVTSSTHLYSITYGNGLFVIIGYYYILTSTDGITWNNILTMYDYKWVKYINNIFYSCYNGTNIITSKNGIDWENTQFKSFNVNFNDIIFENNLYLIAGQGGVYTSSDGINWINRTSNILNGITFGNNLFVAVGAIGGIKTSSDGITWTSRTSGVSVDLYGIKFANNNFIAVGASGTILTSPDGINWTSRTSGVSVDLYGIKFANNNFIAVGASGTILTSPDGITWTSRTSGVSVDLRDIIYKGKYIIVGASGTILTSSDSINWDKTNIGSYYIYRITYGDNLYVITTNTQGVNTLVSPDGINWIKKGAYVGVGIYGVVFANNYFICVGRIGVIINSYISETLNLISDLTPDSDMTFNLEIGKNSIVYSEDNGSGAILKYRQKYIGV